VFSLKLFPVAQRKNPEFFLMALRSFALAAQPDAVRHGAGAAFQSKHNCSLWRAGGRNKSQRNGTRLRPSPSLAAAASNLRPIIQA